MSLFDFKQDQDNEVIEEFQKEVRKYVYEDHNDNKVYKLEYEVKGGEDGTVTRIIAKEICYPLGFNYGNRVEEVLDIKYDVKNSTLKVNAYKYDTSSGVHDDSYIEIKMPASPDMEDPFFTYPDKLEIENVKEVPAIIKDIKEYIAELVKDLLFSKDE